MPLRCLTRQYHRRHRFSGEHHAALSFPTHRNRAAYAGIGGRIMMRE
jgi:hypothetical protein